MLLITFGCLLSTALATPQNYYRQPPYQQRPYQPQPPYPPPVPIVSESNELNPDGSFSYSYVSGDGSQAQVQGYLKNAGQKDTEAEVMQGSYSYTSPDGTPITVNWIADENGFRAEGAHLPTPPPVPDEIKRSLDLISRQPVQEGQYSEEYDKNTFQRHSSFQRRYRY
ncbi:endocuticle structural glycoprotein SgAbd-2-like [Euwallacea fornicatus]|uniref:endocuticle structural glycoprotein SgAbd-2-like n=1 Tax=Euwallacea fornicatus TaxID=995702 RepID=UPI00338F22E7